MAFSASKTGEHVVGDLRMTQGTYTGGSTTGGNINTGLHQVVAMQLTAKGSSIVADAPTIDETFPCDGSAVTVIITNNTDGYWTAFGY
jgi:hypothetical protein